MKIILFIILMSSINNLQAKTIKIAVASNFAPTLKKIIKLFELKTDHKVKIIIGSSGKLFSMIQNSAPFDIFMSADDILPSKLILSDKGVEDSLQTYAYGKLVGWSYTSKVDDVQKHLISGELVSKLALANSKHAPYGKAAIEVLTHLNLLTNYKNKLVIAENVSQAYSFTYTENAQVGLLPFSLILNKGGQVWDIPTKLYSPIKQDLVMLKTSNNKDIAAKFIGFITSKKIQNLIYAAGYLKP